MTENDVAKEPDCLCWHCKIFKQNHCPAFYGCPALIRLRKIKEIIEKNGECSNNEILELTNVTNTKDIETDEK